MPSEIKSKNPPETKIHPSKKVPQFLHDIFHNFGAMDVTNVGGVKIFWNRKIALNVFWSFLKAFVSNVKKTVFSKTRNFEVTSRK